MFNSLSLHHIGIVVPHLESWFKNAGIVIPSGIVYDPVQNARLVLWHGTNTVLELIEPRDDSATTYNFLKKTGGGMHHLCFEIKKEQIAGLIEKKRLIMVMEPVNATLFPENQVMFVYTRNKELVEFLIKDSRNG